MHLLHLPSQLLLQAHDLSVGLAQLVLEPQHELDAGEVEAELGGEPLDDPQAHDVGIGVEPRPARCPVRPHETLRLVHPQRLRMHADELGGDRDHVDRPARGLHQPTAFCSSSRSSRSFLFTRFGTWIRRRASTSPLPEPESFGAPRPLIRRSLPSSEPAGILSDTGPSGVGTSTLPPSAAVGKETVTSTIRSSPRRSYVSEGATRVTTIRSPLGPPFWPASPFPLSRIFVPSLTPGLIFTVNVRRRRSRPEPWHFEHGFSITVPLPRQRGQGCESANRPCDSETTPRPLHSGQMIGAVPGSAPVPPHCEQATVSSTGTFASAPRSESSNERRTSVSTSAPRTGCGRPRPRLARPAPPRLPKMPPRMSPRSPRSPKSTLTAPGPGAPRPLVEPKRSYAFRFSGSDRTSYAVCTCLKRSSADLSPWFVSGWYLRASFRYAFLISSAEAPFFTPSVS